MSYETLEMDSLLEALGFEQPGGRHPYHVECPFHPEDTASCAIYEDGFFCFGCGKGGDGIQFMKELGMGWGKIMAYLEGMGLDSTVERGPRKEPEVLDMTDTFLREATFKGLVDAEALVEAKWPHLSLRWLQTKANVGVGDYNLLIPHRSPTNLGTVPNPIVGIKTRSLLPARLGAKAAYPGSTFTSSLYGPVRARGASACWLCEGESDVWSATHHSEGLANAPQVYGLPCGVQTWREEWLEQLKGYEEVVLWLDNDGPGMEATRRISDRLIKADINVKYGYIPADEDFTSAYIKGLRP